MNYTALQHVYEKRGELSGQSEIINAFVMNALNFIINCVLGHIANPVTITISSSGGIEEYWFEDMISKLLIDYNQTTMQIIIQDNRQMNEYVPGRRYNNLILVDSFESLRDTQLYEHNRYYDNLEYYFIFLQIKDKFMPEHRAKILKYCFENYWLHCSVMIQNSRGEVLVYTYFPFREYTCSKTDAVLINKFEGKQFTKKVMFPNKLKNMHRCPLRLTTWNVPPFVIKKPNQTIDELGGFEITILKTLSVKMNFTLELDNETNAECPTEALEALINRRTNISAGYFRSTARRDAAATSSYFLYHLPLIPLMIQGQNQFNSLDVLTYPFHKHAWLILILTCIILILVNSIRIKSERPCNRWHIIETLLGLPTTHVPQCLTLRISFILWILATFLLRSLYQSLLFYLYRTHFYKMPPDNMAELLQNNYEAVCTESSERFAQYALQNIDYSLPLTVLNTFNEMIPLHYVVEHHDKNIVALTTEDFIFYFAGFEMRHIPPLTTPTQILTNQQISLYFPKHTFLMERFNDYIVRLHQSQLLEKWRRDTVASKYVRKININTSYEKKDLMINMKQVMGFIKVILILYTIGLLIFLIELLSQKVVFFQMLF